jgi:hypothetical protein
MVGPPPPTRPDPAAAATTAAVDDDGALAAPRIVAFTAAGIVRAPFPPSGSAIIGRAPTCDLPLDDRSVSRRHTRITLDPPTVEDLGSRNGTQVRGARLTAGVAVPFAPGDALRVGDVVVFVRGAQQRAALALTVAADGMWFQLGQGAPAHLGRRRVQGRLLQALAEARVTACGHAVTTQDLRNVGWPGERMLAASAANRVYIAIARLRSLGLGHVIVSHPDGYLIPGEIAVVVRPRDAPVPGR